MIHESDTPETDSEENYETNTVPAAFARRLERTIRELKEENNALADRELEVHWKLADIKEELESVKMQLEEARKIAPLEP